MTKKSKKSEESILFPEAKVGDITIKPWSFGVLFDISNLLDEILTKVEEKGIMLEDGFLSYITMIKLFTLANAQVLKIMSITLDMEEEEIRDLPMEDGIKIAFIIARQNWEIISKNVLNLLQATEMEEEKMEEKKEKEKIE